ncbi:MAG: V-type ATP synthase subunit I [Deltaproteobacteria bacterium]
MAIVDLYHATVLGQAKIKHQALEGLQHLGFLHLISQTELAGQGYQVFESSPTYEAYLFLKHCPEKRKQQIEARHFDLGEIESQALSIKEKTLVLEEEKDYLLRRIKNLEPWGNFDFTSLLEMGGLRFWFYAVPVFKLGELEDLDLVWQCVFKDIRHAYVVVISAEEPENMPVARTHTGNRSLAALKKRLDQVEVELEDLYWRRIGLTSWLTLFARALAAAEDRNELAKAARGVYDDGALFAVEAWLPKRNLPGLQDYAERMGLLLTARPPVEGEVPPTLLENTGEWRGGQTLVQFYTTPGYFFWDPSRPVHFFFVIFFAMIISDAGYGLLLGLFWLLTHKRLRRKNNGLDRLLFSLFLGSLLYGILSGSYFGLTPPPTSLLANFHLLDIHNQQQMMLLSVVLGIIHLAVANGAIFLLSKRRTSSLAPLGWIAVLLGGFLLGLQHTAFAGDIDLAPAGKVFLGGGLLVVFFFGSDRKTDRLHPLKSSLFRLMDGLVSLTGLTKIFGDVLSYLRLFALGLASAELAVTFNSLAAEALHEIAGLGTLFAILIVMCGHGLNFLLAVMSGVIHGLRLNFIEFFHWGLAEEGRPFKPFQRRRIGIWNQL